MFKTLWTIMFGTRCSRCGKRISNKTAVVLLLPCEKLCPTCYKKHADAVHLAGN